MRALFLSLPLLVAAPLAPAIASKPAPVCTETAAPPAALAGWAHPAALASGAALTPGSAARVTLQPVGAIRFAVPPGRMSAPADKGALLPFTVAAAGTYRVALGAGGWIDMVKANISVPSSAHAHGPDCTGIRKMVDFPLEAGAYTLQISGAAMDAMTVLIVRLP